ncbi:Crp/Fnr family transcriptional regulator [Cytophagaceae bacterium DM2B3-1]|uniref:Crp/Fnr family transcriptional regulator n=1 Tax=Xanthocytophaga flava TaxID=3048013 RepID=A0ABT7CY86_9BACT|nr:Crp/Fnr family transcriptional regulator [Xanthocytophaga flavus]MDJ1466785.1 Crp/Fnr family transcriptional regulator [Xanthocytophaga flavus]MDJ1498738.1 Crp/Fnr family transcriptional regulator [Xanthocytophaga flavus]
MYDIFHKYLEEKITLTSEESERIRSFAIIKKLRKRQYLLQEGDVWQYHAFITKGCVRTYSVDDKGNEHVIGFASENWWTGDRESLLSGNPSRFNIDAIEDSEIVLFTNANFELLCSEISAFNNLINSILQRSFVVAQNRIEAALSYTAEEKYLNFVNKYPGFATRIPQSMIASYLGMTPETLSRIRSQITKK